MEDTFHLGIKALITNSAGQILLLKVNQANFEKKRDPYYDLPGGRVNRGESIAATLRREVEEEAGITELSEIKEVGMVLANFRIPQQGGDVGLILGIYQCKVKADAKIVLSDEHTEYGWFNPAEAAELIKLKYPENFTQKIAALKINSPQPKVTGIGN